MKRLLLTFAALVMLSQTALSQNAQPPYEVATWPSFRQAAISYTFDDGCPNQFKVAIPMFDEFGFKATLFMVSSWVTSWTELQAVAANGHEVASHTVSHPNLANIPLQQQIVELQNSKSTIESHISGIRCLTIAYPFCAPGIDSVCRQRYISARGCQGFIEPKTPGSYLNVSSVPCGSLAGVKVFDDFKVNFDKAAAANGWCVFLLHGVDNDGGYSPIASAELRRSLAYLSERKGTFWVTTFANATLYSKERDAVKVSEISASKKAIKLQVTDTLPDSIYCYPITLRRPMPQGWPSAKVTQGKRDVATRVARVGATAYLIFDVVPDAGEVKLARCSTPAIPEEVAGSGNEPNGVKR
ncbi:polysaccharide deacetylase family protein [uncultured Acetobacteroides sp.]|uniref:polysaccharide deacetylase family protein n=1 Tax=uncultured Acetobacteroides sp. TaxID=1760811 RepID=UPI0029F4C3BF|nr:polysaccharide deacetylase family protein [uncultured Acetobacteroides sp.]